MNREGYIVIGLHPDRLRFANLAFVIFLSVNDIEQNIGVFGGGFRIKQALPGILEVLSPDLLAVAPLDVVAQVKDDFLAALGDGQRDDADRGRTIESSSPSRRSRVGR